MFKVIEIFFGNFINWSILRMDKIIYLYIITLSSLISLDFYSSFFEIGLTRTEDLYRTFKSINESNLKFYSFKAYFNDAFTESDDYIQNIKSKTEITSDAIPCMEDLAFYDDRICLLTIGTATNIVKYISKLRNHKFNIAKPVFNCLKMKYYFEKSSPYAKKFLYIFRHIHESGIKRILEEEWKNKILPSNTEILKNDEFFLLISLIFTLATGYALSII